MRRKISAYKVFLLCAFAITWIWAAINPVFPRDWLIENYLVFVFVPIILISGIYFKLSNISYTFITIFMILHLIGSHYTYAEVPFGFTLQDWFSAARNMYDRLVHFSFGLLFAYPIYEVFVRITRAKGFWAYYLPLDVTLSMAAVYEILEWLAASRVEQVAGIAFLGAQGDIWDAQKDMMLAGIGAFITMSIIILINWKYDKDFWGDLKESFRIPKKDKPLGEVKLKEMLEDTK